MTLPITHHHIELFQHTLKLRQVIKLTN